MPLAVLLAALGLALAAPRVSDAGAPAAAPPRRLAEGGCACPEVAEDITVCGADGVFYESDCLAACAGVAVADTRDGCAEGCRSVHMCIDGHELGELLEGNIVYVALASPLIAAIMFVSLVFFTLQYQVKVVEARPYGQHNQPLYLDDSGFEYRWWECAGDPTTCCFAWWCPGCRAGDTFQATGFMTYWQVISYWLLCELVGHFVGALLDFTVNPRAPVSPAHEPADMSFLSARVSQAARSVHYLQHFGPPLAALLKAAVFVRGRRQLRARLAGSDHSAPFCQDFLLWTFCSCCVIAQEARQIDGAMGVAVRCCCRLERADGATGMVGEPIKLER